MKEFVKSVNISPSRMFDSNNRNVRHSSVSGHHQSSILRTSNHLNHQQQKQDFKGSNNGVIFEERNVIKERGTIEENEHGNTSGSIVSADFCNHRSTTNRSSSQSTVRSRRLNQINNMKTFEALNAITDMLNSLNDKNLLK